MKVKQTGSFVFSHKSGRSVESSARAQSAASGLLVGCARTPCDVFKSRVFGYVYVLMCVGEEKLLTGHNCTVQTAAVIGRLLRKKKKKKCCHTLTQPAEASTEDRLLLPKGFLFEI